jgi:putative Mg2+ transporter-C (MgtC) family protein
MDPCNIMSSISCDNLGFWGYFLQFFTKYEGECRIFLSTLVGAVIGFERELRGKSAGIRTYAIIAMGSCLFTILSCLAPGTHDTTRIAAQIVSGIGFVGAGVIWHKDGGIVEGLTTAASMWGVSAIGMAIGYGLVSIALTSAITVLIIMELFGLAVKAAKKIFRFKPEKNFE